MCIRDRKKEKKGPMHKKIRKCTGRVRRSFMTVTALAKVLRCAAASELFLQEDANAAFRQLTIPTKVASECYDGDRGVATWKASVAASRSTKQLDPHEEVVDLGHGFPVRSCRPQVSP